jgi:O-antigen/teichoic acid export membrane protein
MSESNYSQKIIMKNTVMLYIRMAVIMGITLYTSRVVLKVLGVDDFGIYNIVGSVVVSLTFIQSALNSATQRFISYELGLGNVERARGVFSMSLNIQLLFLLGIIVLLETVGLWFLNNVLSIPEERIFAANVAYQFSIIAFGANLIRVPYNSVLISFENMSIYAILSIFEAFLRLAAAIALLYSSYDNLILYSILICVVTLMVNASYIIYCKYKYSEVCKYSFVKDKSLFKNMFSFSGWNLFGGLTGMANNEGPNYFINVYLGVAVNAGMGIAKQLSSAVYYFISNFQTAFQPQIVKLYAAKQNKDLERLIFRSSILSYYLLFLISLPLILYMDRVLKLWLGEVPPYSGIFCSLILISQFFNGLSGPLWMLAHAIGNIKKYQLSLSLISCTLLPASWILLEWGFEPYYIIVAMIFVNIAVLIYRVEYAYQRGEFNKRLFYLQVVLRCFAISLLSLPLPLYISLHFSSVFSIVTCLIISSITITILFFIFGLNKEDRAQVVLFLNNNTKRLR